MKREILTVAVLSCLALTTGGCGQSDNLPDFGGGPVDKDYRGVVPAVLTQKFKITQSELDNGIKKEPVRTAGGQILTPESSVEEYVNKTRKGTDDALKPNI